MTIELALTCCILVWTVLGACALTAWAVQHHYRQYVDHIERLLWCYRLTGKEPTVMNPPPRPKDCKPPHDAAPEPTAKIDLSPEACLQRKRQREHEQDPKRNMIRAARERARQG